MSVLRRASQFAAVLKMSIQSTGLSDYEKPRRGGRRARAPPSDDSLTVPEFCRAEKISRSFYYKLRRLGLGPDEMSILTAVRISAKARDRWRRKREKAAADEAKKEGAAA